MQVYTLDDCSVLCYQLERTLHKIIPAILDNTYACFIL